MTAVAPAPTTKRPRFSPLALVEALATPHGVDRYLELVHPMLTVRDMRAEVTAVHRATPDSVTLELRPTRQWKGFAAGQFVQITVDIDGVRRSRCFSPAGSAHRRDRIELTVKAHRDGVVSRYLYDRAVPGLVVGLSQADGTFRVPDERPARTLLVSGGSGITPVLSMLRTLCDEGHRGDVTFLHYARTPDDVPYLHELRRLAAEHDNVTVVLAYTADDGGDARGHFTPAHLETAAPWHTDAETFVCGPAGLMDAVRAHYANAGLSDRLHTEEFTPPTFVADAADATGTVSFTRSDRQAANTGTTLLEQAEAAGLSPEHGCRMGICFSCTQVKRSGCTRNVRTGDLHTEPDEEIQLCISVPVGDVAIDV